MLSKIVKENPGETANVIAKYITERTGEKWSRGRTRYYLIKMDEKLKLIRSEFIKENFLLKRLFYPLAWYNTFPYDTVDTKEQLILLKDAIREIETEKEKKMKIFLSDIFKNKIKEFNLRLPDLESN